MTICLFYDDIIIDVIFRSDETKIIIQHQIVKSYYNIKIFNRSYIGGRVAGSRNLSKLFKIRPAYRQGAMPFKKQTKCFTTDFNSRLRRNWQLK